MAQKYIAASVGVADIISKTSGEIIGRSNTLINSGVSFAVTPNDIKGGDGNRLLGQYFSDATMKITLEDALFDLNYLALNTGGTISVGGDVMTTEQITTSVENKITVTDTPQEFMEMGTIGWYSLAGKDTWTKITFVGSEATVSGLASGTTVCVKYQKLDSTSEQFTVSSSFIPDQCYLLLTLPLFKTGLDTTVYTSASKVGYIQIAVPSYQLSGAMDLSFTSGGATTSSISGVALASMGNDVSCDSVGDYAYVKKIIIDQDEFENVKAIVAEDSDIDLTTGEDQLLVLYKMYDGNTILPSLLDNSKVTFTSDGAGVATVSTSGVVTAVGSGTATITCVVTSNTDLVATALVTIA